MENPIVLSGWQNTFQTKIIPRSTKNSNFPAVRTKELFQSGEVQQWLFWVLRHEKTWSCGIIISSNPFKRVFQLPPSKFTPNKTFYFLHHFWMFSQRLVATSKLIWVFWVIFDALTIIHGSTFIRYHKLVVGATQYPHHFLSGSKNWNICLLLLFFASKLDKLS